MTTFVKFMRSEASDFLESEPIANHVLSVIARRARRTPHPYNGLETNECHMGDYEKLGISRQQYRSAMDKLEKWGLVTTKATNKGTVATLTNTDVYDINTNEQPAEQPASNQPANQPVTNQVTTNKELKNGKNSRTQENYLFDDFWKIYPGPRKKDKPKSRTLFNKQSKATQELIINHIRQRAAHDPEWTKEGGKYIPGPVPFLNQNGWTDEYVSSKQNDPRHSHYYAETGSEIHKPGKRSDTGGPRRIGE